MQFSEGVKIKTFFTGGRGGMQDHQSFFKEKLPEVFPPINKNKLIRRGRISKDKVTKIK